MSLDHETEDAVRSRFDTIGDFYDARIEMMPSNVRDANQKTPVYRPLPKEMLYLTESEWEDLSNQRPVFEFSRSRRGEIPIGRLISEVGGQGDFGDVRHRPDVNVFDAFRERISRENERPIVIFAYSNGSRDRLTSLLRDHHVRDVLPLDTWAEATERGPGSVSVVALDLARGFSTPEFLSFSEQDILGERMARPARRRRRAEEFISEASSLNDGDLIVHIDHGVGRYIKLETLKVDNTSHDCLTVEYSGGDRLYVPVENIDVLSRFGNGNPTRNWIASAGLLGRRERQRSKNASV